MLAHSEMEAEKAFEITWRQLPQRSLWLKTQEKDHAPSLALHSGHLQTIGKPHKASALAAKQPGGWKYLDHTADVQVFSWGANMGEAFGAVVVGMYGYMTELDEIDDDLEIQIAVEGHDIYSLLYAMMNECLYSFHTEQFVGKEVIVKYLDTKKWKLGAIVRGGLFDPSHHSQGTEVKAITYSNMQVIDKGKDGFETYVILDI